MDPLSGSIRALRIPEAVYVQARLTAPWCLEWPPDHVLGRDLHGATDCLVALHRLASGRCRLEMASQPTLELGPDDVVLVPLGTPHRLGSDLSHTTTPLAPRCGMPGVLHLGGGGQACELVSGLLLCDARTGRALLSTLPPVLLLNRRAGPQSEWLERSFRLAVAQSGAGPPGAAGALSRLSEALMAQVLLGALEQAVPGRTGWPAGRGDRVVDAALALMHERPAHPWTLEQLARQAGTSRSVLAERFSHVLAQSPMAYLARWRLGLAQDLLRSSTMDLTRVAHEVGYQTDTALSRAFRREFGQPPAAWRRQEHRATAAPAWPSGSATDIRPIRLRVAPDKAHRQGAT